MKAQATGTAVQRATWDYITAALADPMLQIGIAGPPGVSKTHATMQCRVNSSNTSLAKVTHKIQSHSELSPAEILGMYVPIDQTFDWMPGPIDICYSQGGLLVIDEIIEASGPVKTFLYGAMDRGPGGTISYAGRVFEQQPGYQVVATMNGWPDQGGLPPALLDRFDAWFIVTQPSEEQLALLESDLRDICRDSYDPEVVEDEMAGPDITFRMLMGLQKLRKIMPLEMAVLSSCRGNKILAQSLYEVLQLTDSEEDEPEPVEYSKGAVRPAAQVKTGKAVFVGGSGVTVKDVPIVDDDEDDDLYGSDDKDDDDGLEDEWEDE
jgi:hypothetical protein